MTANACDLPNCPGSTPVPWHLKKEVGLDVIVAFIALLAAGVGYVVVEATWKGTITTRVDDLEKADVRMTVDAKTQKDDLTKRLDRFDEKLDRLLGERGRR